MKGKHEVFLLAEICFSMSLFSKSRPERAQTTGSSGVTPDTGGRSEKSKRKTQTLAGLKQMGDGEEEQLQRRRRERKKERKKGMATYLHRTCRRSSIYPQKTSSSSSPEQEQEQEQEQRNGSRKPLLNLNLSL